MVKLNRKMEILYRISKVGFLCEIRKVGVICITNRGKRVLCTTSKGGFVWLRKRPNVSLFSLHLGLYWVFNLSCSLFIIVHFCNLSMESIFFLLIVVLINCLSWFCMSFGVWITNYLVFFVCWTAKFKRKERVVDVS